VKLIWKALVALAILPPLPNQSLAQTSSAKTSQYVTRIQLMTRNQAETYDDCIAVFEGGTFRREHWTLHARILESGSPGAKTLAEPSATVSVFVGRISEDELKRLQDLLDASALRSIPTTATSAGRHLIKDEVFSLSIYRGGDTQRLVFFNKESRAPYKKDLAPVLKWFGEMQKYPAQTLPSAQSNRCGGSQ
jgi:hypothetical protein